MLLDIVRKDRKITSLFYKKESKHAKKLQISPASIHNSKGSKQERLPLQKNCVFLQVINQNLTKNNI